VTFSNDSQRIFIPRVSKENTIEILNANTGECERAIKFKFSPRIINHYSEPLHFSVSPDEKLILINNIELIDLNTNQLVYRFDPSVTYPGRFDGSLTNLYRFDPPVTHPRLTVRRFVGRSLVFGPDSDQITGIDFSGGYGVLTIWKLNR
ncbi:MAG: hypothetical protein VX776_00385, partial [Planctomycetota bacterium]|nr:hypothetical protein [Planctomycetota bacterium]